MKRNILVKKDDSILFDGFKLLDNTQKVNIMILGFKKVIISSKTPEKLLSCHNIVEIKDKICYDKQIIKKLHEAGVYGDCSFIETNDSYILNISSKENN